MGDTGSGAGFLSPRRLEAIHISFNRVFESALKDGLIRNAGTYPSLDNLVDLSASRKRKRDEIPAPQRSPSPEVAEQEQGTETEAMQIDFLPPLDDEPLQTDTPPPQAAPSPVIKQSPSTSLTSPPTSHRKPARRSSALLKRHPSKSTSPAAARPPQKRKRDPTKRYRRPAEEIDRRFKCDFRDCEKGYGYLHHLNTHREQARHGPKLMLDGTPLLRGGVD